VLWFSYLFYFVCLCNATIRGERKITIDWTWPTTLSHWPPASCHHCYIYACLKLHHWASHVSSSVRQHWEITYRLQMAQIRISQHKKFDIFI